MTYRNIDPTAGGFGSDWGMYGGAGSNYSGGGDEIWNDLSNFGGSTASRAAAAFAQQEKINSFNATLEGTELQIGNNGNWQDNRENKDDSQDGAGSLGSLYGDADQNTQSDDNKESFKLVLKIKDVRKQRKMELLFLTSI